MLDKNKKLGIATALIGASAVVAAKVYSMIKTEREDVELDEEFMEEESDSE